MDEVKYLQQVADLHRRRFEQTVIGKAKVAKDFTFINVNEQLCLYLGLTKAELIGRKFTDITPEPIRSIDAANARMVAEAKITRYRLPKIYELPPYARRIYVLIDVIGVYRCDPPAEKCFDYFDVEIMETTRQDYLLQIKETLKNHVQEGGQGTSAIGASLSSLRKFSPKDIREWAVVLAILAVTVWEVSKLLGVSLKEFFGQLH